MEDRGPRPRRVASARLLGAALVLVLAAGCGHGPRIASGTLARAKVRVAALVNATGTAVGSRVAFVPVPTADELPCKKTLFGFTVGDTGAHRAEVPVEVRVTSGDGAALLPGIERYWRSQGYTIDRSGLSDRQFPKVRAHVGTDDLLVATGYVGLPRLNLYGVSACVRS
jgi:hypothetical protein